MHFDILVNEEQKDENQIFKYGKTYLKSRMQDGQQLTSKECNFCHIDQASDDVEQQILKNGFFIIEMENCV
jgi:hypothetical protein